MSPTLNAREFAELAEAMSSEPTPAETAEQVVAFAQKELDADWAGITLIRGDGSLRTLAPTAPLVASIDELQHELGEGTCLDTSWRGQVLSVSDLGSDARWPSWGPKVTALGVKSALAAELTTDEKRIGSINLYWGQSRPIRAADAAYAQIFSRHAALALVASLNDANLHVALDTRKVIGAAQGILVERHSLSMDQAFHVLMRYSQDHNIKLRQIAERLVTTGTLPSQGKAESRRQGAPERR